eukprot:TRINITY_DN10987_c0_g1_i1.p1 TRINITY_DN10987_c0_g1~~TRINITY_DN10987_c0_g1_i1.p1  ORF type:complete len:686 (+),score=76.01 TRINITY_DN10987_c0_g1_i1:110-2059(+)
MEESHDGSEDELSDSSLVALPLKPKPVPNWADEEDCGFYPDTLPRRCTDCLCIPFYAVCLSVMLVCSVHIAVHSSLQAESKFSGRDYMGMPCGKEDNAGKPNTYFCLKEQTADQFLVDNKEVNTRFPLCVAECPDAWNETIDCYVGDGKIVPVRTYASIANQRICTPVAGNAGNQIFGEVVLFLLQHHPILLAMSILEKSVVILCGVGVASMILAFFYILLVSKYVATIVWSGLACCVLGPAIAAVYFKICSHHGGCGSIVPQRSQEGCFIALLALSTVLACVICRSADGINKAVVCMHWSCKCVQEVPALRLVPMVRALWDVAILDFHSFVMLCVWSSTDVYSLDKDVTGRPDVREGADQFTPGMAGIVMIVNVFFCIWNLFTLHQINNIAIVFGAEAWFFQGGIRDSTATTRPSIMRGYWIAIRYHLGTCIHAGLVITVVAPFRIPLAFIVGMVRFPNNPLGVCFHGCCDGLVDMYDNHLSGFSTQAIYDVVLNGYPFCKAAHHSTSILAEEGEVAGILKGATWLFEIAAVGTFAFAGFYGMSAILAYGGYSDPTSPQFVIAPFITALLSTFTAVLTSYPFTHLFRITSDAILYSRTVEKQREVPALGSESHFGRKLCSVDLGWLVCMDGERHASSVRDMPKNHHEA